MPQQDPQPEETTPAAQPSPHGCGAGCDHDHSAPPAAPATPGLRGAVERASLPLLTRLSGLPVWLPLALVLVLILGGAWLGGWAGGIAVGVALIAVLWLIYLFWPHLSPVERLMRLTVVFLVLAVAATQFFPN